MTNFSKALKSAKQAQGMLTKVMAMIERDDDCPNIVQQVDSVGGFLHSVKRELLSAHLERRMEEGVNNKPEFRKELLKLYHLAD